MKSLIKYLLLLIVWFVAAGLGAIFFLVQASNIEEGKQTAWTSLEVPPEKAVRVMAPYYIKTVTGKLFHYNSLPCQSDCWQEVEKVESYSNELLSVSDCGWYPDINSYADSLAICERFGPGYYKRVWAIDQKGSVWFWEKEISEGGAITMLMSPFAGFLKVLFIGGIIITSVTFIDGLITSIKLKNDNSSLIQISLLDISTLVLIIAPLLAFLYLLFTLNTEIRSSFLLLFFCITPFPLVGTIAGIVTKNRTKIILGLLSILFMVFVWLRFFQI